MPLNLNQFAQVPVKGNLDLQIAQSGVISGLIGSGQSGTLYPGAPVKLDTTNASGTPRFVSASESEVAFGYLINSVKKSSFVANDPCEVAMGITGPVMFMEANAAINPGAVVQQNANGKVETLASNKARGIALDKAAASGDLIRVLITTPLSHLS